MRIFYSLLMLLGMLLTWQTTSYAAFGQNSNLPSIAICEVKSYGENSLRQEFFYTFEELLTEKLQESHKLRVEPIVNVDPVFSDGVMLPLDDFFATIHMNAIVNGKEFDRARANRRLVKYYDSLPRKPKGTGNVYFLAPELRQRIQEIGQMNGYDYLLFCNLKYVDVALKGNENILTFQTVKGSKLKLNMDYYLINAHTGKVLEGTSFADKSSQVFDVIFVKYGKSFTVAQMLQTLLEVQAGRTVDRITSEGLRQVGKNE
jgi:hypothetical protein